MYLCLYLYVYVYIWAHGCLPLGSVRGVGVRRLGARLDALDARDVGQRHAASLLQGAGLNSKYRT